MYEEMTKTWIDVFDSTEWIGAGELWLDPEGNNVDRSECSMTIEANTLLYQWSYEDEIQQGSFEFFGDGATWSDSWHQPNSAKCLSVQKTNSLFAIEHCYSESSELSWRWRSQLSERPDGSLVLQMTNIAPWGEEARAVRMIFKKQDNQLGTE